MQELKRIINYKRIILLLIAVTVNVVFFLYDNKPVMDEDIINKENVAHETYIKNYHEEVNAIIDNADKLKKYSIFNKDSSDGKVDFVLVTFLNCLLTPSIILVVYIIVLISCGKLKNG